MKYIALLLIFSSSLASAGGWSNLGTPTRIDLERSYGFMVYGSFGNPNGCTLGDRVYIPSSHGQYKEIYSTVLAAFMAGKKIQVYVKSCEPNA